MSLSATVPTLLPETNALEQRLLPSPKQQSSSTIPTQSTQTPHRQHQPFHHHQQNIVNTSIAIRDQAATSLNSSRNLNHNKIQWLVERENQVASPPEARRASMAPRSSRATPARLVFRLVHKFVGYRVTFFLLPPSSSLRGERVRRRISYPASRVINSSKLDLNPTTRQPSLESPTTKTCTVADIIGTRVTSKNDEL